jgi:putative tryptophan/tyrosine transport system substrate-binding protein
MPGLDAVRRVSHYSRNQPPGAKTAMFSHITKGTQDFTRFLFRRRGVISLFSAAALAALLDAPRAAALSASKVWRIGYLSSKYGPSELSQSFIEGLRELGYIEGQNLVVEYRLAMGKNDRLPELAADLVRARVDLIATEGTPSTRAAMNATSTIPIVFGSAQDPVEKGIVASFAHPGGNVTGNALIADLIKPLAFLKEAVPGVSRVAFIYDPATRSGAYGEAKLREIQDQARALDVIVRPVLLRDPDETDRVFAALPPETSGLLVENSVINLLAQERICSLGAQRGLPTVGTFPEFSHSGCLMSYGENLPLVYRRAAGYVDKIFKGAQPADLPIQQPVKFELVVNLRTAKALNLRIPESFLIRADEVIE